MGSTDRRRLLAWSGTGAIAAKAGGLAAILATGRAPAYAQGTTIHWLRWNDFVPASDQLLRREVTQECQRALGIRLNIETVNANDIQARVTSAVQSGSGPDVFNVLNNWPQLYAQSAADVSDIAEEVAAAQGGFYEVSKAVAHDGRRWLAVPFSIVGNTFAYRKSWFEEVGHAEFPRTWEQYRDAGKKLKAKGRPLGQTLGQTFGDAPTFAYPYLWSWGGKEVEADGRTVALNSRETVESVRFMVGFWKDAFDEGGLAWDDSNNNRAFLSGTVAVDPERRLDLHRIAAPPAGLPDRARRADEGRHPARHHAGRARRVLPFPPALLEHAAGLLAQRGRGAALPALDALQGRVREVVRHAEGLLRRRDHLLGAAPDLERGSGDAALPRRRAGRARAGIRRAVRCQGGRGGDQVHRGQHVRQGGAGHGARAGRARGA